MTREQERMQLQKKIMELDRQMGVKIEERSGRVSRVRPDSASFPLGTWILSFLIMAWALLGNMLSASLHGQTKTLAFIVAIVVALVAALNTVRFILGKLKPDKSGPANLDQDENVRKLRIERDALKEQLEELNKIEKGR